MKYILKILLSLGMIFVVTGSAFSASTSTYLYVTAYVGPQISASIGESSLYFFTNTGINASASGNLYINGALGQALKITMNSGLYYDGFYRRVSDGYGNYIRYYVYKPGGVEWGDSDFNNTYPAGSSLSYTGKGFDDSISFNAYLFAPSIAGNYSDVVTVTLYW